MLQFYQDEDEARMILTLTELVTIATPYYLFVFTHVTTKEQVKFVKAEADDESNYPQRYNQFTIDSSVIFGTKPTGEWHYKVYEQDSATNLIPELAIGVVEEGKLIINRPVGFNYSQYNGSTTYKSYNG